MHRNHPCEKYANLGSHRIRLVCLHAKVRKEIEVAPIVTWSSRRRRCLWLRGMALGQVLPTRAKLRADSSTRHQRASVHNCLLWDARRSDFGCARCLGWEKGLLVRTK